MKHIQIGLLFGLLAAAFFLGWFFPDTSPSPSAKSSLTQQQIKPLPDFTGFKDVKKKKQAFFAYLLPMVQTANQAILKERQWLNQLQKQSSISQQDMNQMLALAEKYKVSTLKPNQVLSLLLEHVDIIPVSLALAQAANESAWGTSRFARQGNNLFGQWCYVKGCGLVPLKQVPGQHYEVASFKNIQASINSYMRNLNSQFSYKDFRVLRKQLREQNQPITGLTLAEGLLSYSTRREHYIHEIQSMILHNQLGQYDH